MINCRCLSGTYVNNDPGNNYWTHGTYKFQRMHEHVFTLISKFNFLHEMHSECNFMHFTIFEKYLPASHALATAATAATVAIAVAAQCSHCLTCQSHLPNVLDFSHYAVCLQIYYTAQSATTSNEHGFHT